MKNASTKQTTWACAQYSNSLRESTFYAAKWKLRRLCAPKVWVEYQNFIKEHCADDVTLRCIEKPERLPSH